MDLSCDQFLDAFLNYFTRILFLSVGHFGIHENVGTQLPFTESPEVNTSGLLTRAGIPLSVAAVLLLQTRNEAESVVNSFYISNMFTFTNHVFNFKQADFNYTYF